MVPLLFLFLNLLFSPFRPIGRLEAENAALRHQVAILQRKLRGRIEFTTAIACSLFCCIDYFRRSSRR